MNEQAPTNELPDEIQIEDLDVKINDEGKKYEYEKGGVYYGGDYLHELPEEIDLTMPQSPEEKNSVL